MMKNLVLMYVFFVSGLAIAATNDTIKLNQLPTQFSLYLPPYIEVLEDKNRVINIENIRIDTTLKFGKPAIESHLGMAGSAWWVRFSIKNNLKNATLLLANFNNLHLNQVDFYLTTGNSKKIIHTEKTGDLLPFRQRPLLTREFVFDMQLEKDQDYICYFYFDNSFEPISLPFYLHTPSSFAEAEAKFTAIFFVVSGILLAMSLISFYVFIHYRQSIFLFYTLVTLSNLIWASCNYGFAYQWFYPSYPDLQNKLIMFFPLLSFVFFIPFLKKFFQVNIHTTLHHRLLNCSLWVGIGLVLGFPVYYTTTYISVAATYTNMLWSFFLVMFVIYTWVIIQSFRHHPTKANLFFTIGFILMLVGAIINVVRELIPLPVNVWVEHGCIAGQLMEVLFTGFAIALNINTLLKDREKLLVERSNHQRELLKTEINAEENERRRIAADLHDDLGILLSSAKMEVTNLRNPDRIIELIDQSILKIRQITQKLHPSVVDQFGLVSVLEDFLEELALSVPFKLNYTIAPDIMIDKNNQINIFRIVTELLNNAVKHSKAQIVNFELVLKKDKKGEFIHINIEDDGVGMAAQREKKGIGLSNIESRVQIMNGKVRMDNKIGKGLKISILIPTKS